MAYLWKCPQCGKGKRLGARPRRDATDRFCLDCSKKTGTLVPRVCPRLETRRSAGKARTQRKQETKRRRAAAIYMVGGYDLRKLLRRVWTVARRLEPGISRKPPRLQVQYRGGGGRAWIGRPTWDTKLQLNRGRKGHTLPLRWIFDTLVHEVAHFTACERGDWGHGDTFKAAHADLEQECAHIREEIEKSASST